MTADHISTDVPRHEPRFAPSPDVAADDEPIGGLISAAWSAIRNRAWMVALGVTVGVGLGILAVRLSPPLYEARLIFAQQQEDKSPRGVASLVSQLGIDIRPPSNDNVDVYASLLTDPWLMTYLMKRDPSFLERLYPSQWDPETKTWHAPPGFVPSVLRTIKSLAGLSPWDPPTAATAAQNLTGRIDISEARTTGFRTLTIRGSDPKQILWLVTSLHEGANELVRDRARQKSERRIAYLADKLRTETEMAQRQALADLLREEEKRLMLSRIDANYAVQVVSPPQVLPVPASKRLRAPLLIGFFGGGLIGGLFALRSEARKSAHRRGAA